MSCETFPRLDPNWDFDFIENSLPLKTYVVSSEYVLGNPNFDGSFCQSMFLAACERTC